jgi:hypothetical protein
MIKVSKEREKKIMDLVRKAGDPENYEVSHDERGIPVVKKKANVKSGRISKARGARFELKVRKDLESQGRVVDKWTNNVDLELDKVMIAKRKYNPFSRVMTIGTGFPDFVSIKKVRDDLYSVIAVECKMNGTLSKIEKEKCAWLLKEGVFSAIWIAKMGEKRGQIVYDDFKEKYGAKYNKP